MSTHILATFKHFSFVNVEIRRPLNIIAPLMNYTDDDDDDDDGTILHNYGRAWLSVELNN